MAKDKDSHYREAVERLRESHSDKVEEVFLTMYGIVKGQGPEKDKVNAAKVCVSLLGVPRQPAAAKETASPAEAKKNRPKKPELPAQLKEQLDRLMTNGSARY
jgi:hypothetical protein